VCFRLQHIKCESSKNEKYGERFLLKKATELSGKKNENIVREHDFYTPIPGVDGGGYVYGTQNWTVGGAATSAGVLARITWLLVPPGVGL